MIPRPITFTEIAEDDVIEISGVCVSIKCRPWLENVGGRVATVSPAERNADERIYIQLWPEQEIDNGMLWFCEDAVKSVVLIERVEIRSEF